MHSIYYYIVLDIIISTFSEIKVYTNTFNFYVTKPSAVAVIYDLCIIYYAYVISSNRADERYAFKMCLSEKPKHIIRKYLL